MERSEISKPTENVENGREKLSDEELANLLAALGNSEAKALTLLMLGYDCIYGKEDLSRLLNSIQGDTPSWKVSRGLPFAYCKQSLAPIGLVAMEATTPGGDTLGWTKTEYGRDVGDALAGHLLAYSEKHNDMSLRVIFGKTASVGKTKIVETERGAIDVKKRSPQTNTHLLWILATTDLPITELELYEQMGGLDEVGSMTEHLKALTEAGVINYSSRELDKDVVYYKKCDVEESDFYGANYSLKKAPFRDEVWELVKNTDGWFSAREISEKYCDKHPERKRGKVTANSVGFALDKIFDAGYVERDKSKKFKYSKIEMTEQQRDAVVDLLDILYRFQIDEPGFRREGILIGKQILADENRVSSLMEKARASSPDANKLPKKYTNDILIKILTENPGLDSNEIRKKMEDDFDVNLKTASLYQYLTDLASVNRVKKEMIKGVLHWSTVEVLENGKH